MGTNLTHTTKKPPTTPCKNSGLPWTGTSLKAQPKYLIILICKRQKSSLLPKIWLSPHLFFYELKNILSIKPKISRGFELDFIELQSEPSDRDWETESSFGVCK